MAKKSMGAAYAFWALGLFGILGFHRFYLGRVGSGIIYLLTLGVLGFGAFVDLFLIPDMVKDTHRDAELDDLRASALAVSKAAEKKRKKRTVASQ